jgi:hypothetical protein
MNKRHIIHLSHAARERCPRCASQLPQAGAVVTDSARVTQFVCNAHLAQLAGVCDLIEQATPQEPVAAPADHGATFTPPPPAGSDDEMAETALAVGFPGAFGVTSRTVEQLIRARILWPS